VYSIVDSNCPEINLDTVVFLFSRAQRRARYCKHLPQAPSFC
jgi:hypothetical protein